MKVLMLHGVNHNMFGKRDPQQYGTITLDEINASLHKLGQELGAEVEHVVVHAVQHQNFHDKSFLRDKEGFAAHAAKPWRAITCPTSWQVQQPLCAPCRSRLAVP